MSEICKAPTISVRAVKAASGAPAVHHQPGYSPRGRKLAKAKKPSKSLRKTNEAVVVADNCEPAVVADAVKILPLVPEVVAKKPAPAPDELKDILAAVNRGDESTATAAGPTATGGSSADGGLSEATRVTRTTETAPTTTPTVNLPTTGTSLPPVVNLPSITPPGTGTTPVLPVAPSTPVTKIVLAAASDSGVSSADKITNVNKPVLEGTGEPNTNVIITVKDAGGHTIQYSAPVDDKGNWVLDTATAAAINDTSMPPGGLSEGTVDLTVVTTNTSGISATSTGSFVLDVTPPTIAIAVDPASPNPDKPVLLITAEAGQSTVNVTIKNSAGEDVVYKNVPVDANGKATLDLATAVPTTGSIGNGLPHDEITYVATQDDIAGNVGSGTLVVTPIAVDPSVTNGTEGGSAIEGNPLVYKVHLDGTTTAPQYLSLGIGAAGDTATAGQDYTTTGLTFTNGVTYDATTGLLRVPAGVTDFTISVPTVDDTVIEPNESLTLVVGNASVVGTIIDNDGEPSIGTVTPGGVDANGNPIGTEVVEGNPLAFTVAMTKASSTVTTFDLQIAGVTATEGQDFTRAFTFTNGVTYDAATGKISVPAGVTSFAILVPTLDDQIIEPTETLKLTVGGVDVTGTILDNDGTPSIGTVTPGGTDASGNPIGAEVVEGNPLAFTVALEKASSTPSTFDLKLAGVTATEGQDFTRAFTFTNGVTYDAATGKITVPAGVTSFAILVPTIDDALIESTETLKLTVGGVDVTGTILDNDGTPTIGTITPGGTDSSGNPIGATVVEGNPLAFTVALEKASSTPSTFDLKLAGVTATEGQDFTNAYTFTNGVTYDAATGKITVPAGVLSFQINVPTLDDQIIESTETVKLTLGGVDVTGTIIDNDGEPSIGTVTPGGTDANGNVIPAEVVEGNPLAFTVAMTKAASTVTTFDLQIAGVTATAGQDFTSAYTFTNGVTFDAATGKISVPAGVTSFQINVPTIDDQIIEPTETLKLTVGGVAVTGTILDNDGTQTVTGVTPGGTDASGVVIPAAVEEGNPLAFTVALNKASSTATSFDLKLAGVTATLGSDFTNAFTFTNGVTYDAATGKITVPAGVTGFQINVPTIDDKLIESTETLKLTVGGVDVTGTILDNDSAIPTVVLNPGKDLAVVEMGAVGIGTGETTTTGNEGTGQIGGLEELLSGGAGVPLAAGQIAEAGTTFVPTNLLGTYGRFLMMADGKWTYLLDNGAAATQALQTDEVKFDAFKVYDSNGNVRELQVEVHGQNDAPRTSTDFAFMPAAAAGTTNLNAVGATVSGNALANDYDQDGGALKVTEIKNTTLTDIKTITDGTVRVDGAFGHLEIDSTGKYTYTQDRPVSLGMNGEPSTPETFTYAVSDGKGGITDEQIIIRFSPSPDTFEHLIEAKPGDSTLYAHDGVRDVFSWSLAPTGTDGFESVDTVKGFHLNNTESAGDVLNIKDLLPAGTSAGSIDKYLQASTDASGNLVLKISHDGTFTDAVTTSPATVDAAHQAGTVSYAPLQTITLEGVQLQDHSTAALNQLVQDMITNHKLIIE